MCLRKLIFKNRVNILILVGDELKHQRFLTFAFASDKGVALR
jgi:hypothetical protein